MRPSPVTSLDESELILEALEVHLAKSDERNAPSMKRVITGVLLALAASYVIFLAPL